MIDYITRVADPAIDRINDNICFDVDHLIFEYDCLDLTVSCDKPGDPELIRRPDDEVLDRLSDRYPNLNRPADNPMVDRLVDDPELERR